MKFLIVGSGRNWVWQPGQVLSARDDQERMLG